MTTTSILIHTDLSSTILWLVGRLPSPSRGAAACVSI